jgi:hypothetical protein
LNGNNGNFTSFQSSFIDDNRRRRQNVPIGPDVRKRAKEFVGNRKARGSSIILGTNEKHARAPMVGQIVGERTNRLPSGIRSVALPRLFALDDVRFGVVQKRLKIFIRVSNHGLLGFKGL